MLFPHALVDAPLSVQQVRHIHKGGEISHFLVWFQFINVDSAGRSLPEARPGYHLTVIWHLLLLGFSTSPSAPHPFPCTVWPIYPISPLAKKNSTSGPWKLPYLSTQVASVLRCTRKRLPTKGNVTSSSVSGSWGQLSLCASLCCLGVLLRLIFVSLSFQFQGPWGLKDSHWVWLLLPLLCCWAWHWPRLVPPAVGVGGISVLPFDF